MQYQGGKYIISSDVARIIGGGTNQFEISRWKIKNSERISASHEGGHNRNVLVSLFCGACNVEAKVKGYDEIICNDNQPYLIALFKALQDGYELPEIITEEDYHYVKDHKDENPALTGFVGFACSFGGKWFGGYARDKAQVNYALRGKKSLAQKMKGLMDAKFTCLDYRDVELPDGCVIYADPPYANTTKYANQDFDTESFWEYMRKISKNHIVYISELNAPDDFVAIWQKEIRRILDVNKNNQFKSTEKLYVHRDNLEIIQNNA